MPTIILIGPMSAGKSTVAGVLVEQLGMPRVELDEYRWDYFNEIGYDNDAARRIVEAEGMVGLLRYWKPFEVHAVERVLAEHRDCVIDFGAGYTVQDDPALLARVGAALAPFPDVILLLPTPDPDESIAILNQRFSQLLRDEVGAVDPALLEVNAQFVRHPANRRLAKRIIYTNGKTPDDVSAEIVRDLAP